MKKLYEYKIVEKKKIKYIEMDGEQFRINEPAIISASRSTDIPAFFSEWFLNVLKRGYTKRINPFNQKPYFISFENTRFIVFWTKNPKPLIKHLDEINTLIKGKEDDYQFYFQFTLNDYEKEGFEPNVPPLKERIETFKKLSEKIGKEKVIWRFDPLILTDKLNVDALLDKIERIGDEIHDYTEKLVFSFADIGIYRKVRNNMAKAGVNYSEFNNAKMLEFGEKLSALNKKWNLKLTTCCETVDLTQFGIEKNKCIDDELIEKISHGNPKLMEWLYGEKNYEKYLKAKDKLLQTDFSEDRDKQEEAKKEIKRKIAELKRKLKDKGQRESCGCVKSTDIGAYNTCMHLCVYCYANTSPETVKKGYSEFIKNSE